MSDDNKVRNSILDKDLRITRMACLKLASEWFLVRGKNIDEDGLFELTDSFVGYVYDGKK